MAISCSDFNDYLFRQMPHYDQAILQDWHPTDDAWIGHMKAMQWDPFTGTEHTYDQARAAFPDLSGCWQTVNTNADGCLTAPCATPEKFIGWGWDRKTYGYEKMSYRTQVLCFDDIITRQKAKEQLSIIVDMLKRNSMTIQSDWMRRKAVQANTHIYIAGSGLDRVTITGDTFDPNCTTIDLGSDANLPTSMLTMPYLQRLVPRLKMDGYFKRKYIPGGMLKLITDEVTAYQLTNGNPQLTQNFRYDDFAVGGNLYKYGLSTAVGNYGIAYDFFPMRFYRTADGVLTRVFPYTNGAATIGIGQDVSTEYLEAPYQMNYVWHPEAMIRLTPKMVSVNPEMPFLTRDLAGKWYFEVPSGDFSAPNPVNGEICTYNNQRRNMGYFWADFQNGIKAEYPEWTRAILSLRDPGCVTDMPRCSPTPDYVIQDNSSANEPCFEEEV